MSEIEFLIGLLGAVALAGWVARAARLPLPLVLLVAGLVIGVIPGIPDVELDPDVIFLVFLPPLVHSAAYWSTPRHLRRDVRPLGLLAFGVVALTTVAVAAVAHAVVDGLSWPAAFVLGAALAPTDTVAATAVFRRLGVPERIVSLVEGESLINDGLALVVYRIAVGAAVTGTFSLADGARDLLLAGSGGALLGLAVAWIVGQVRRRIDDSMLEITITLLTPYLAWIPAEELGLSGILAAVSSGLYLGWRGHELFSPGTRLQARPFWDVLVFVLESLLFILIGLQFPGVLDRLSDEPAATLALYAAVVSAVVIATRLVFPFTIGALDELLERRRGYRRAPLSASERIVIGWSGMRGAVTLGAALAIPLETDAGTAFPERDLILFLTLSVIAVTLTLQSLTLPLLVRRLGLEERTSGERRRVLARFRTVEAALERVGELSYDGAFPDEVVERAREMYTSRARQLAGLCRAGVPVTEHGDETAWRRLRRDLLAVERRALLELRDQGVVSAPVMADVEQELDMEEARLRPPAARDASEPAVRLVEAER